MDFFSAVSVVSISTFNLSEVETSPVAAMVSLCSKAFSHFGIQTLGVFGIDMGMRGGFIMQVEMAIDGGVLLASGSATLESHKFYCK